MTARFIGLLAACFIALPAAVQAQTGAAQSFDSNGVQIAYADRGRGAPVVLLHGYTGTYARHWEAPGVMQALETAGYRVVAMDCRGHGQSGKPSDPAQYGIEMVNDVVRLLDHLKIERAHIVGYSMGGAIASQLLVRHPGRLLTITVLGSGWDGEDLKDLKAWSQALADGMARKDASGLLRAGELDRRRTERADGRGNGGDECRALRPQRSAGTRGGRANAAGADGHSASEPRGVNAARAGDHRRAGRGARGGQADEDGSAANGNRRAAGRESRDQRQAVSRASGGVSRQASARVNGASGAQQTFAAAVAKRG
jgi:pimeloyl-ACP methyl ester carboxylesterase